MGKSNFNVKNFKSKPIFWSRLGFPYDPPMLNSDGKPLVFSEDFSDYLKFHKQFLEQGVKIHTSILHSGWVGVDKYDYSLADRVLDSIMGLSDELLYMPRIKLNPPLEWCKQNPEEVFLYYDAPRNKDEISALVGTLKQDILGYESPSGYYCPGDFVDPRPNVDGVIGMQSISSQKWLSDATEALTRLITRVEQKEYADRIIGYQVCFGPSGEDMYWGRASSRYGDYGITALKNFYDFGLEKYKDEKTLKEVWKQPNLTRDNVVLPSPFDRYGKNKNQTLKDLFRAGEDDVIIVDYDEFISKTVCDAMEALAQTAKKLSNNKLVGGFYGYIHECGNCNYAGHLQIERLLNSPNFDFFAAPMSYETRLDGESGGEMTPVNSFNLKKQWVDETDLRTYIAKDSNKSFKSFDKEGTRCSLWREACKNICHNSGFWWMDLGGGWFDDEFILEQINQITKLTERLGQKPYQSVSDVLVVVDENSYYKLKENDSLRKAFISDFLSKVRKSGALVDTFRLSDLQDIDLEKYKLVIFANTYLLSKEDLDKLNFNKSATFMFNYASGIWDGENFSLANVKKLTGFEVEEEIDDKNDFPMLKVVGEAGLLIGKKIDGKTVYLNADANITEKAIHDVASEAGCHIYTDSGLTVYGDNRLIYVSSKTGYIGEINFGKGVRVKNLFTGEIIVGKDKLSLGEFGFNVYEKL